MNRSARRDVACSASDELVKQFALLAAEQEDAIHGGENARYNCLYDRVMEIEKELKRRPGDERRLLCRLYRQKSNYVRLQAAFSTLAVEPTLSRQTLREISEAEDYPATAEARMMLLDLERGSFVPE